MKRTRRNWILLVPIFLALVFAPGVEARKADHGTFAHWNRDFDGTFGSACDQRGLGQYEYAEVELWDSLDASWRAAGVLQDAIAQYEDAMWEGTLCVRVTQKSNTLGTRQNCADVLGAVRICNGTWPNWDVYYGVFTASPGTGHLENSYMNLRLDDNEIGPTYNERLKFMCHELGHALGLDEGFNQPQPSCINNNANSTAPSQHDIDTLNSRYQHTHEYEDFNLHWNRRFFPGECSATTSAHAVIWDSTDASWRATGILADIAEDWENVTSNKLCVRVVLGTNDPTFRQSCPEATGRIRVCNGTWSGVEYSEYEVWTNGVHLDNAQMRVRLDDAEIGTTFESRRYILCHEIGHALGLDAHNPNPASCMNVGTVTPDPDDFDKSTLNADYAHTH